MILGIRVFKNRNSLNVMIAPTKRFIGTDCLIDAALLCIADKDARELQGAVDIGLAIARGQKGLYIVESLDEKPPARRLNAFCLFGGVILDALEQVFVTDVRLDGHIFR